MQGQDKAVIKFGISWSLSAWFADGCLLAVSSHSVLSVCRPLVSFCVSNIFLLIRTSVRLDSCPHILPNFTFCCFPVLSRARLCDPMDYRAPGFPVLHQLPEFVQTLAYWVSDAIQQSHPLLPPSPPAFNLSQQQSLFHWVNSSHQVAKILEFQLQHESFQWIFKVDFL